MQRTNAASSITSERSSRALDVFQEIAASGEKNRRNRISFIADSSIYICQRKPSLVGKRGPGWFGHHLETIAVLAVPEIAPAADDR